MVWYCCFFIFQKSKQRCHYQKCKKDRFKTKMCFFVLSLSTYFNAVECFFGKEPFSIFLLQRFPLLKTNATVRYLSVIWGYFYRSRLNLSYEMKSKLFLLCSESVCLIIFCAFSQQLIFLLQCFHTVSTTPTSGLTMKGSCVSKKKCVFCCGNTSATVLGVVICFHDMQHPHL